MLRPGGCPDARSSAVISATIPSIHSQPYFFHFSFDGPPDGTERARRRLATSTRDKSLNPLYLVALQGEIECRQVGLHVRSVGGPCQRYDADVEGEAKNDLTDAPFTTAGNPNHFRMVEDL